MKLFPLLCYFYGLAKGYDLPLPLREHDRRMLSVRSFTFEDDNDPVAMGLAYSFTYIISTRDHIIKKVFYRGVMLFSDPEERDPGFTRIVNWTKYLGRTYIYIFQDTNYLEQEASFYIANRTIYDLSKTKTLMDLNSGRIGGETPGKFLTTLIVKIPDENYESVIEQDPEDDDPNDTGVIGMETIANDINTIFEKSILDRNGLYVFNRPLPPNNQ